MAETQYPVAPDYEALPEKELISRCQSGNLEAFNVLISRYEERVINMALGYLRDYHQAVDEAQEIFLKVFRKINSFKGNSAFATWLYRVTANHCFNAAKRNRRHGQGYTVSLDREDEDGRLPVLRDSKAVNPEDVYARKQTRQQLAELIQHLPDLQRQMIVLCHFENMSYVEIAEIMEVPATTVRSSLFRARQRLKQLLEKKGERK